MARCLDGSSSYVPSIYGGQGAHRILFGSFSLDIRIRCSGVSGRLFDLDLLLGADPAVWGGNYPRVRFEVRSKIGTKFLAANCAAAVVLSELRFLAILAAKQQLAQEFQRS